MKEAIICEKMHWTHSDYLNQPNWLIDILLLKWSLENEHIDKQNKNINNYGNQ